MENSPTKAALIVEQPVEINGRTFIGFDAVTYSDSEKDFVIRDAQGQLVRDDQGQLVIEKAGATHIYGLYKNAKNETKRWHIKNDDLLSVYGHAGEVYSTGEKVVPATKENTTIAPVSSVTMTAPAVGRRVKTPATPEIKKAAENAKVAQATLGAGSVAVNAATGNSRKGILSRVRTRVDAWGDDKVAQFNQWRQERSDRKGSFLSNHKKAFRSALAGVAFVTGAWSLHALNGHDDPTRLPAAALAGAHPGSTTMLKVAPGTSVEAPAAPAPTPEQQAHIDATNAKLAAIGMQPGQYNQITDPNAQLPGSYEAVAASFNGNVWNQPGHSEIDAVHESADELNARNGFDQSRANASIQNLKNFGAPDSVINQLKNINTLGNYATDNMSLSMFTLAPNVTSADYEGMSWYNNGDPAVEADRLVSPANQDAFAILTFKDVNGNMQAIAFRVDCGGANIQAFQSMSVTVEQSPTPAAPQAAPAPAPQAPSTPGETSSTTAGSPTTTAPAETTTTTGASTTTTVPRTTTTTGATTTTVPRTTTTTGATTTTVPRTTTTTGATTTTVPSTTSTTKGGDPGVGG